MEQAAEVLNERERFVIEALYFQNLSPMEAAVRMKVSVQRVSQLKQAALKKLKKRLEA